MTRGHTVDGRLAVPGPIRLAALSRTQTEFSRGEEPVGIAPSTLTTRRRATRHPGSGPSPGVNRSGQQPAHIADRGQRRRTDSATSADSGPAGRALIGNDEEPCSGDLSGDGDPTPARSETALRTPR